ncbi:acetolactate synthase large subunit [Actinospongicola halichondriae]|uniref:acetolactate synthase large subunit n=1 Tax=Actinospongicola halichondriae TaxID=3236844 RepID=UPI003D4730DD
MNGAELALRTAVGAGVDVCFANPGTTEMELVAAVDRVPSMRAVLGLFEGVVTGAADGYGRVTGRPALTVLHLGPGFANGIANLHNARRAHTPVVNLVGDHASWHLGVDAPLTSDIESLARPVSRHVARVSSGAHAGTAMREAIGAAMGPPSGVSTLIFPQDAAWGQAKVHDVSEGSSTSVTIDADAISLAAAGLRSGVKAGLLLGGVVRRAELEAAAAVQAATGCSVWIDTFPAVLEQGAGIPHFDPIPYFPEQALEVLASVQTLVVAGTRAPVAFFGYQRLGISELLPADASVVSIAPPGVRGSEGLEALVAAVAAARAKSAPHDGSPTVPTGDLDMMTMGAMVAALQPEGAIVVNESATSGLGWAIASAGAAPHEAFSLTGGAIGQGLPCAVGAAVAAPDRKVITLQADGSGMYTLQSLWTMARESLDVTVVVCANRAYRILQMELHRTGHDDAGPQARSLTDLSDPAPDWVSLAKGFGVEGMQATTLDELRAGLERGLSTEGPYLVEAIL